MNQVFYNRDMLTKQCPKCREIKPISEFSKSGGTKYHSHCKACVSIYYRDWYSKHGRQRADDYAEICWLWYWLNRDKAKVKYIVKKAIEAGILKKPTGCEICGGEGRINGHHENYSYPLKVLWICSSCHKKIHNDKATPAKAVSEIQKGAV